MNGSDVEGHISPCYHREFSYVSGQAVLKSKIAPLALLILFCFSQPPGLLAQPLAFPPIQFVGSGVGNGIDTPVNFTLSADGRHGYLSSERSSLGGTLTLFDVDRIMPIEILTQGGLESGDRRVSNVGRYALLAGNDRFLYSIGVSGGITVYSRDPASGRLAQRQELVVPDVPELVHLAITVNENFIFAVGFNSLVALSRDPATGVLEVMQTLRSGDTDPAGNPVNFGRVVHSPTRVYVSPDDRWLFTVSAFDDRILLFSVEPDSGELSLAQELVNGLPDADGRSISELSFPSGLVFSPNNGSFYVSGSNTISQFRQDTDTGLVTFVSTVSLSENRRAIIGGIVNLKVTADGLNLYAQSCCALVRHSLHPDTGAPTFAENWSTTDADGNPIGQYFFESMMFNNDESRVYMSDSLGDRLVVFERRNETGSLAVVEVVTNSGQPCISGPRLDNPVATALNLSGTRLYVVSSDTNSLLTYDVNNVTRRLTWMHTLPLGEPSEAFFTSDPSPLASVELSEDGRWIFILLKTLVLTELTSIELGPDGVPAGNPVLGTDGSQVGPPLALHSQGENVFVGKRFELHRYRFDPSTRRFELLETLPVGAIAVESAGDLLVTGSVLGLEFFRVNPDGSLTSTQKISAEESDPTGAPAPSVDHLAVALDGNAVYAMGPGQTSLLVYLRDSKSGLFGLAQTFSLINGFAKYARPRWDTSSFSLSEDGTALYVVSTFRNVSPLVRFSVLNDGTLGAGQTVLDRDLVIPGTTDNFYVARHVTASPDGRTAYLALADSDGVLVAGFSDQVSQIGMESPVWEKSCLAGID